MPENYAKQTATPAKWHGRSHLEQGTRIFAAEKDARPALMQAYLQRWYEASRREPHCDGHRRDTSFWGDWSWEAAAITCVLDMADSSDRGAPFYPADLVALCRRQGKGRCA
ncbi:MAG: DUF1911 domain-containing protein [Janthinobacterium sp.]